ncbi:TIGR04222 domain-containing membrane protein [Rhizohabitans arisaemae]|uniref:TIGR04222 domain-containing membrane protein n=1 Tax=Rhizohabitans arisaemae TaxID=2720610 RepID=UPI0024B25879|nr:TIGR04222 domain-containing membrane protein [Rhizohabitans arisaemae]
MNTVLLIISLVLLTAMVWASAARRAHRRVDSRGGTGLDAYGLAYLAGGPLRVVNTAVAVLSTKGVIRVSRGQVARVAGSRIKIVNPIEGEILSVVTREHAPEPGRIRRQVADGSAMKGLADDLVRRGLIHPPLRGQQRREAIIPGVTLFTLLTAILSIVLGDGDSEDSRTFITRVICAVTVVVGVAALVRYRRYRKKKLTVLGRRTLASAQISRPRTTAGRMTPATGRVAAGAMATSIALYGLSEVGDPALASELEIQRSAGPGAGGCAAGACGSTSPDTSSGGDWGSSGGSGGSGGGDFGGGGSGSSCGGGSGSSGCGGGGGGCGGGGGG